MPITKSDITDCCNKLIVYGEKLKKNLVKDRTECKQIIKTKAATFDEYSAGFSDSIAKAYDGIINFEISFSDVQNKIQEIIDGARKEISDKSTLDKSTLDRFNRAAKSIKSQINASKYGVSVINETETRKALATCESKLNQIHRDTKVNPQIIIAGKTCDFSELINTLTETLTEDNKLSFLNELKELTTTDTIIQAFRKKGVFIYDNKLAADTKPLPKEYISEYLAYLEAYGKKIQRCLNTNRIFCQAGIKEEVKTLAKYFPILATAHKTDMVIKRDASADEAKQDIKGVISQIASESRTVLKETKNLEMLAHYFPTFISEIATQDIEVVISKIALKSSMALEKTKKNVDALIDEYLSVSSVEKDPKVKQFHKYCSDQLKKIQEHTKINPDVKIGEKTYKFIDLIDAVKTSIVERSGDNILVGLDDYKLENSIISSFIDAGVYVTERSL